MRKRIIILSAVLCVTLGLPTIAMAETSITYGDTILVDGEDGEFNVTIDEISRAQDLDGNGMEVVAVQCVVENIDFDGIYDNSVCAYEIGSGYVTLKDADGFSCEFYDVSGPAPVNGYEVAAKTKAGEKKRVALLYYVTPGNTEFSIVVSGENVLECSLSGSEENETVVQDVSVEDEELQKKIETLESENADVQAQVEVLEGEKSDLQEQVETLEVEKADMQSQIDTLTAENEALKLQIEELEAGQTETEIVEETEVETEAAPAVTYTDKTTTKVVQEALNKAGYNCGTPDGIAGSKTGEAIKAYQTEKGISVNGVITDELLESLGIAEEIAEAAAKEASKSKYSADYTYEQLARNPDTYIGDMVKFSGKVLQAQTGDVNYMRLAINSDYDTVLFVTYDSDVIDYRLLEDDYVTVYGTSFGNYSYEAVSGATITIPWVMADIIEM